MAGMASRNQRRNLFESDHGWDRRLQADPIRDRFAISAPNDWGVPEMARRAHLCIVGPRKCRNFS
jgi:hypothetical protein